MAQRKAPAEIARLFEKPGRDWTAPERVAFRQWLHVPEQFARDREVVQAELHRKARGLATPQDVEGVVTVFHGLRMEGVIDGYDPQRGDRAGSYEDRFWAYYNTSLRNESRHRARELRNTRGREVAIDGARAGDAGVGQTLVDGRIVPADVQAIEAERARMLRECIAEALTDDERRLLRDRMDDAPFADLAARLNVKAGTLRVRRHRVLETLRTCLETKGINKALSAHVAARPPDLEVDVVIIGGGVMGLCLASALKRHYSVVVLERDRLGCGQTCHSHLYIHQGYLYRDDVTLAKSVKESAGLWHDWLERRASVARAHMPSIFGFRTPGQASRRVMFWEHPELQLPSTPALPLPDVLAGGEIRLARATPEECLDGDSLIAALARDVSECVSRVTSVTFAAKTGPDRIDRVNAVLPSGQWISIQPRAVVFAAGSGNQALLHASVAAAGWPATAVERAQQIRQSHMLVIRGRADKLPLLTGIFSLSHELFIVARRSGDDTVWLVSDERSPTLRTPSDARRWSLDWWLPGVRQALTELAPTIFDAPMRRNLEWRGYDAPKAEGRTLDHRRPSGVTIGQYGFRNLWAVWPTKLTLAPVASRELAQAIGELLGVGRRWCPPPASWANVQSAPACASELWRDDALGPWNRNWS